MDHHNLDNRDRFQDEWRQDHSATPPRKRSLIIGWKHVLFVIILFIFLNILGGFLAALFDSLSEQNWTEIVFQGYYILLADALFLLVAVLFIKRVRQFLWQSFSLAPMKEARTYLYIIAGFCIFYISQYVLISVLKIDDPSSQSQDLGYDQLTGSSWVQYALFYFAVTIITPIKEEFLYRGLIHRFLGLRYHFIVGLMISSLIFGLLHIGFPVSATIMGLVLVLVYHLTRTLAAPIVLHIAWNVLACVSLAFG